MEGRLVLKNCAVVTREGRVRSGVAIVVNGERIERIAPDGEVPVLPGDWEIAAKGRLVVPGLSDCHAHLVGTQLLPPSIAVRLGTEQARVTHQRHLEEALTPSEVEALTAYALANAARNGVTFVAEHLSCPSDVLGGLEAQARAAERIGVRLNNSHASSSRAGRETGIAQVEQNLEYLRRVPGPLVRPAVGFESSATADDALLERISRGEARSLHFHLGATEEDLRATYQTCGCRIVPRLANFGLLGPGTIAAYARTVDTSEVERLTETHTLLAITPIPSVETAGRFDAVLTDGPVLGLGSAEVRTYPRVLTMAAEAVVSRARHGRLGDPDAFLRRIVHAGIGAYCARLYGAPVAILEEGSLADLAIHELIFPVETGRPPITNPLMLLPDARVAWTIVNGRVVVREGQLLGADLLTLAAEATRALESVRARALA